MPWPIGCVRAREPLANHTSFRIGGPAEWFAEPSTVDELTDILREAHRRGLPVSVVGGGTNTLAADRGIRGLVIHLGKGFKSLEEVRDPEPTVVRILCGAGVLTQRLVSMAAVRGWGDLELLAGLPGQIGGAVAMNAQDIGRFVHAIRLLRLDGTVLDVQRDQLHFRYRYTALEPGILTHVELRLPRVTPAEAYERIHQALSYRNRTQEVGLPSAGCAFKNPPGVGAGKLIDQAGLKGARIGDAKVSHRHANFIVNTGRASCDDVLSLMEHIQRQVHRTFGVLLEPEVRMIGERL